jgi:predicted MFS family arabinose efflux permease
MYMLGEEKDLFGRVRIGGTIGFGITALIVGLMVESYELNVAFWIAAGLLFLGFLVSLKLVYEQESAQLVGHEGGIRDLLINPNWVFFLLIAFISGVAFAANNSYFFPYMSELGIDSSAMGLALTIGTIAEIPVLLLANRFIKRFNAFGTLILSVAFTGLRLILFGLTGNLAAVMFIQIFNGISIPLLMVAGVSYADQLAPEGLHTTAQGLFNAVMFGFGTAVGGFICGLLLVRIGGQALYLVIGLAVLLVLAIVLFLRSRLSLLPRVPN